MKTPKIDKNTHAYNAFYFAAMDSLKAMTARKDEIKYAGDQATIIADQFVKALGLSDEDFDNIEVALRLRVESCEDNEDKKAAADWRRTHKAIEKLIYGK